MAVVATALCVYLVLTLGATALAKNASHLASSMVRQGLMGRRSASIAAAVIRPAEVSVALGLVLGVAPAVFAAVALLGAFTAYRLLLVRRGVVSPCACIGMNTRPIDNADVVASAVMVTAAAAYAALFALGVRANVAGVTAVVVAVAIGVVGVRIRRSGSAAGWGYS